LNNRIVTHGYKAVVGDIVLVDKVPTLLTESNLADYNIKDIVLPIPGTDALCPINAMKDDYKRFMAEHDIDCDNMEHAQQYFILFSK